MSDPCEGVVVIGAGPAGLAAAGALARRGVRATVLEGTTDVASSWRSRHPDLHLNTPGWLSGLPGRRCSVRRYGEYPTRDAWVDYLADYAGFGPFPFEFGVTVLRIDPEEGGWRLTTTAGDRQARAVVVATGSDRVPHVPDWPDREQFPGELLHAAAFTHAAAYRGRDVLVVGPNVSGVEIATLLSQAGAERVRIAVRTPPNLITRKRFGISVNITGIALQRCPTPFVDALVRQLWRGRAAALAKHGLPRAPVGVASSVRRHRMPPAFDEGFTAAVIAGRIEVVPAVSAVGAPGVTLADGAVIEPDVVIAATGYRRDLEPLVGHLDVLDREGWPRATGADQVPGARGLYFNGFRGDLSGMLRPMRIDARAIARDISRGQGRRRGDTRVGATGIEPVTTSL